MRSAVAEDPGLQFWLAFAEGEGALCEDAGDHSLVVLPERLQGEMDLPEEAVVTADPEVAREDGSILLAPGHRLLSRAAELVIARGDVGTAHLPWGDRPPPSGPALEARAREHLDVDHGRIDVAGHPVPVYLPVLRVGVLVSYSVSLDDRFLEREEVLVDATTGLALPAAAAIMAGGPLRPGRPPDRQVIEADLGLALGGAHALLEPRIAARRLALSRQSERGRREELDRAGAYYQAALDSIARRQGSATPQRQALLDAQAAATAVERDRRLAEIEDTFSPTHELRPYRLHLLGLPAVALPVDIRRGPRRFPARLVWVPGAACFAAPRCPACSSSQPWVAGKDHLGCRSCLGSPTMSLVGGNGQAGKAASQEADQPRAGSPARPAPGAGDGSGAGEEIPPPAATRPARRPPAATAGRAQAATAGRAQAATAGRAQAPRTAAAGRRATKAGRKLALDLWSAAGGCHRWPASATAAASPLAALHRLYGPMAPLRAIGVAPRELPEQLTTVTAQHPREPFLVTSGCLLAGGAPYPYTLRWQFGAREKPVVGEVLPFPTVEGTRLPSARRQWSSTGRRLAELAPPPTCSLDGVGTALWEVEPALRGLTFLVRCLAAWWRLQGASALTTEDPPAAAAGLVRLVARRSGLRISDATAGAPYGVDKATTARMAGLLRERLGPTAGLSW